MDDIIDLLKIKIEKAKRELPEETQNAIAAVDWKATILGLREKKGYSFEQLGDLELETELVLCGLVSPENYQKELEKRMGISSTEANELTKEMNTLVFSKIREELIKNTERKKLSANEAIAEKSNNQVLDSAGIKIVESETPIQVSENKNENPTENREDILKDIEKPEGIHPILTQKLSGSFQKPIVKTDHSPNNISPAQNEGMQKKKIDPYREIPE